MSAFHRVDSILDMPAQKLVDRFIRLAAYPGVIKALVEAENYERMNPTPQRAPAAMASKPRKVKSDLATLAADEAFEGLIEVRTADAGQGVQAT